MAEGVGKGFGSFRYGRAERDIADRVLAGVTGQRRSRVTGLRKGDGPAEVLRIGVWKGWHMSAELLQKAVWQRWRGRFMSCGWGFGRGGGLGRDIASSGEEGDLGERGVKCAGDVGFKAAEERLRARLLRLGGEDSWT